MKKSFSFLVSTAFLLTACNSSGGGALSSTISEFSSIFSGADSAFESLGSVGFGGEGARNFAALTGIKVGDTQSTLDAKCSEHGSPWEDGVGQMALDNTLYSSRLFYCLATLGEGGPDTVRGSYSTPKAVLCAVDSALGDVEYTEGGNTFENVSVSTSSGCFTSSMLEDMGDVSSITLDSITFTELDPLTTGWQKKVELMSTDAGVHYTLYSFKTADRYGFRSVEAGNGSGTGGIVSLMVDTTTGDLVYSNLDDRGGPAPTKGPDSLYKRFTRVRVNGDVASDGTFTQLNSASGVYAQSGSAVIYDDLDKNFTMATIKGNSTVGYKSYAYSVTDTDGSSSSLPSMGGAISNNCFDGDESCTDDMPAIAADATSFFQKTSSNSSAWADYRENGKPLCASDVTFSAVPANGNLGVCD